jgi:hypothetical protein
LGIGIKGINTASLLRGSFAESGCGWEMKCKVVVLAIPIVVAQETGVRALEIPA